MASVPQDELLAYLLSQRPAPKRGGCLNAFGWALSLAMFATVMALAVPQLLNTYAPGVLERATPAVGTIVPTPTIVGVPPRQQPVVAPLPDCATVQDTRTACQGAQESLDQNEASVSQKTEAPTPTPAPTPTAQGFWTAEEQAQFAATAEAFYDPATLPTAPPTFEAIVRDGCNDPAKRAASPLLDSWCGVGDD